MKKNIFIKTICLSLVLLLVVPGGAFALGDTIENDNEVIDGIISAVVPTEAGTTFAINPLEYGDQGSQITTSDFMFVNKSNVDVKAAIDLYLVRNTDNGAVGDTYEILDSPDTINGDDGDESNTKPQIFVYAAPASDVTLDSTDDTNATLDADTPVAYEASGEAIIGDNNEGAANVTFFLEKATYEAEPVNEEDFQETAGKSAFGVYRLKGKVNSFADYAEGDLTLTTVYNIRGITNTFYQTATGTDGLNIKSISSAKLPDVDPSITSNSSVVAGQAITFTIDKGRGENAITDTINETKVEVSLNGAAVVNVATMGATFGENTVTLPGTLTTQFGAGKSFTVKVYFGDGSQTLTSDAVSVTAS